MLGVQVHDVGGKQKDENGTLCEKLDDFPSLRLNRPLRKGEVVTIEPGCYFIPMLLNPKKQSHLSQYFNWPLIESLVSFGGIRIEDNLLVQEQTPRNLTREVLRG